MNASWTLLSAELLEQRLAEVRRRLALAAARAGRSDDTVRILAVTKGHPAPVAQLAHECGLHDLGESRVHEAQQKQRSLGGHVDGEPFRWHLVGHLQTNKARLAARLFDVVHSVDSDRVAEALSAARQPGAQPLSVLVEVELTGITQRTGVRQEAAAALVRRITALPHLELRGLMTIAPRDSVDAARQCFRRLRILRDEAEHVAGGALPELSMGMSDDFEVAVEEGSTTVRLGRILFEGAASP